MELSNNPSKQEVFDFALAKILEQGKPSFSDDVKGKCLYNGPMGVRCVVGHMLPKNFPAPELNGKDVYRLISHESFPEHLSWMKDQTMMFLLKSLQGCHDQAALGGRHDGSFLKRFKENMKDVSEVHGLKYKEPQ